MSRARGGLLVFTALAADAVAGALVGRAGLAAPAGALALHLGATTLWALAFSALSSPEWKKDAARLGAAFALCVPILGPAALLVIAGVSGLRGPVEGGLAVIETRFGSERRAGRQARRGVGEGGLYGKLRWASDVAERQHAVLGTRTLEDRRAVPLLRLAMRDPEEEPRLLAHALLQAREDRGERRVGELLEALDNVPARERASVHLLLAHAYWELAYGGVATGDIERFARSRARDHLELAEGLGGVAAADRALLSGRLHLVEGDYRGATRSFETCARAGMPGMVLEPYRAEARWMLETA